MKLYDFHHIGFLHESNPTRAGIFDFSLTPWQELLSKTFHSVLFLGNTPKFFIIIIGVICYLSLGTVLSCQFFWKAGEKKKDTSLIFLWKHVLCNVVHVQDELSHSHLLNSNDLKFEKLQLLVPYMNQNT